MSQTLESSSTSAIAPPAGDVASLPGSFRFPNPLRAGMVSFFATIAVIGCLLAALNVAVNRGIDGYYETRIAALGTPPTDPAFAAAQAQLAKDAAADSAATDATVSAN